MIFPGSLIAELPIKRRDAGASPAWGAASSNASKDYIAYHAGGCKVRILTLGAKV